MHALDKEGGLMRVWVLSCIVVCLLFTSALARKTVALNAQSNLQSAIDASPANTRFVLKKGRYLRVQITPKPGNMFVGEEGTVFDGDGVVPHPFLGKVNGITVSGIEITGHNNRAQTGAIGGGDNQTIEDCEVHHNAGGGIDIGSNCRILNNYVHHNGQIGLIHGGHNSLVEGNEISYNNYQDAYDPGWEAGGTKFWETQGLTVRNNHSHHNHGPGLWSDYRNQDITYEGNLVEYNQQMGIFHEISYDAIIRCNISRFNAENYTKERDWLYGGQIFISTSQNVEIYNNVVIVSAEGGNGITVVNQRRGSDWYSRNVNVYDNDITYLGDVGISGAASDYDRDAFFANGNNSFDHNTYHCLDTLKNHWEWNGMPVDWEDMRGAGQERNGIVDFNLDGAAYYPDCAGLMEFETFMALDPSTLTFILDKGTGTSEVQEITVTNGGSGDLQKAESWAVYHDSDGWLALSDPAVAGNTQTVQVAVNNAAQMPGGTYEATVIVACPNAAPQEIEVPVSLTISAPPVFTSAVITPGAVAVQPGESIRFLAEALDQYGRPLDTQPSFTWEVSGGGAIDGAGSFTSNDQEGSFTVTARSEGIEAVASIDIFSAASLAPGYLKHLMCLEDESGSPYLPLGDGFIDSDFLGDEGANVPEPGLEETVNGVSCTWAERTDGDGIWGDDHGRDGFVAYWAITVVSPTSQTAYLRYRHDEDLKIWQNGKVVLQVSGWDQHQEKQSSAIALQEGDNAFLIKLVEVGGENTFGMRLADADGNDIDNLSYYFGTRINPIKRPSGARLSKRVAPRITGGRGVLTVAMPHAGAHHIEVTLPNGRRVMQARGAGSHEYRYSRETLSAGVYLIRAYAGGRTISRRCLLY
ncbi:MAG: hypothetical protein GF418_06595 [Chitinivibrionales bacterium]|nr:hypothetical protein [Chitinivibrionales bacterium]MBD3395279.1 hypothetical protein [Chitinivibrionales bacterium]